MITCKFENGKEVALRHVVVHCLAIKDNQILLVKRAGEILESGKWGFPGGFLDQGESLEECTVRELKEETGYEGKVIELFHINSNPKRPHDNGRNNVAMEFIVEIGKKSGEPDWEQSDVNWFDINKIDPETLAFDHGKTIEHLKKYLKGEVQIPIIE